MGVHKYHVSYSVNVWNLSETGKERDLLLGHSFHSVSLGIFLSCTESKSSLSRQAAREQKQVCFQYSQESGASDN